MARIRSIKPEFPHSESMGRVSRDARLTFIQLWTLADDAGRLRGNSRMLASLLFPYDDDAPSLIEGWLGELEKEDCIVRYQAGDTSYVQISNWLTHQKIDKPSPSKIPGLDEASRILSKPREHSSGDQGLDQGSRIKEGKGEDHPDTSAAPTERAEVLLVMDHWRKALDHPKAQFDKLRKRRIVDGLKTYTVQQLCDAITGYTHSPHHTGTDPKGNGVRYDDIELLLRDTKHIEQGLQFYAQPPKPPPSTGRQVVPMKLKTAEEWEAIERERGESHVAN